MCGLFLCVGCEDVLLWVLGWGCFGCCGCFLRLWGCFGVLAGVFSGLFRSVVKGVLGLVGVLACFGFCPFLTVFLGPPGGVLGLFWLFCDVFGVL